MIEPVKILIVEDEMLLAANTAMQVEEMGHVVVGIFPRGEDALLHIRQTPPDLMLVDIRLNGDLDGIDTVREMQKTHDIPVLYLTANTDQSHFDRAKETHPYAFVSKPANKTDLERAVDVVVRRISHERKSSEADTNESEAGAPFLLRDCIYVRDHDKMIKVCIPDIYYIEAERNYSRIHAKGRRHLLVATLKEMDQKLPDAYFLRIHRSFIINLMHIDEVATGHLIIDHKAIPMNKAMREELLKRLQTI